VKRAKKIKNKLTFDLWAVDDSDELKKLEDAARRKDSFAIRSQGCAMYVLLGGAIGTVVRLTTSGWATEAFVAASTGLSVFLWGRWIRKRIRVNLPEVLVENGRCCNCGYDLQGIHEPRCPECGTPFKPGGSGHRPDKVGTEGGAS